MVWESHDAIRRRLDGERGRIEKRDGAAVALAYPSPYHAGMSSLGFQQVYKLIQASDGFRCARTFLPDDAAQREVTPLTYEDLRPLSHYPIIAFSVAYELELAGLVSMLERSDIPSLREERAEEHPFVLAGGPLTFSNPLPLAAFADAIVMGEAEELVVPVLE
ncbi:MAG: radical SAM protein, partial [Polyangiaceae bacterium]|nr:radical SAM protein [Polyangiaceae bacterium]